jgi:hypothetical protein
MSGHEKLLHEDIKGLNVLVTYGTVCICDFGGFAPMHTTRMQATFEVGDVYNKNGYVNDIAHLGFQLACLIEELCTETFGLIKLSTLKKMKQQAKIERNERLRSDLLADMQRNNLPDFLRRLAGIKRDFSRVRDTDDSIFRNDITRLNQHFMNMVARSPLTTGQLVQDIIEPPSDIRDNGLVRNPFSDTTAYGFLMYEHAVQTIEKGYRGRCCCPCGCMRMRNSGEDWHPVAPVQKNVYPIYNRHIVDNRFYIVCNDCDHETYNSPTHECLCGESGLRWPNKPWNEWTSDDIETVLAACNPDSQVQPDTTGATLDAALALYKDAYRSGSKFEVLLNRVEQFKKVAT